MIPIRGGVITAPFDEMRPLAVPPAKRWHMNGDVDDALAKIRVAKEEIQRHLVEAGCK